VPPHEKVIEFTIPIKEIGPGFSPKLGEIPRIDEPSVARWSQDGRHFESVKWSGSHAASLRMVREGAAAIASIDCVSFGYLMQEDPASLQGVAILQHSVPSPGLPWVASRNAPPELTARLRAALLEPAPVLRALFDSLHIRGFEQRSDADYGRILQIEAEARAAGYPDLA